MISLVLRLVLALVCVPALAADANTRQSLNTLEMSQLSFVSDSACTRDCENKYMECGRGRTGKDMKRCAAERKLCYRGCAAAVSRAECTKGCDGKYFQCGKGGGAKDMKQCANDRKVCYRRCS